jgi:LacI family transcriptional regulator
LKNKKTTIKYIAKRLGIHHSTVSRALRDHPDVTPETKALVKKTAEEMNYRPNMFARSLKNNESKLIGVIVPEIRHHFFADVIGGIEEVASKHGFIILVAQSNESYEREVANTNAFAENRIAGLLVSISQETKDGAHFQKYLDEGGKIVFFDRFLENFNAAKVVVDDYNGAFKATEYLIKKGRKNIAHIAGTKQLAISRKRFEGYRDALKKYGLPFKKSNVVWAGFHEKDGAEAMRKLLKNKTVPDAIFSVNDPTAIGAYEVIEKAGLIIPTDIAVVGFSNNPISAFVRPALTTIEQPSYEMGMVAMELLISQLQKSGGGKKPTKVLKTRLIRRNSV